MARCLVLTVVLLLCIDGVLDFRKANASVGVGLAPAPAAAAPDGAAGPKGAVADWLRKVGTGPAGLLAIAGCEVLALLFCLPGYSVAEYTAGAMFGGLQGIVACTAAKGLSAILAYVMILSLRDSPAGKWAEQRVQGGSTGRTGARFSEKLRIGIERDCFKFCVLVRCSPLPAWLSNYALPLAGVPFWTYLPASLLGMLPPIATNVYAGAAAASVASVMTGGGFASPRIGGVVALALSVLSSAKLAHQLASVSDEEVDAHRNAMPDQDNGNAC